ncbi:MAG: pantoate kinase [Promethearchaeota archaeon]|jgi:pantoate kinase
MESSTNQIIVEVPHRISGFFEIVDKKNGIPIENPEKIGSRGAGFNVSGVGKTAISYEKLEKGEESQCTIFINEEKLNEKAETTYFIFKYVKNLIGYPINIKIEHKFDLPVGCGYGASGSGALGTIFGLNKLLSLNLTDLESGRIAHIAEVVNKTGLGTVCGQIGGGLCILKEPGYPCNYERLNPPKSLLVLCGSFGAIRTKSILSDEKLSSKIKQAGKSALKNLLSEPNYRNFINVSKQFVEDIQIIEILKLERIKDLLNDLYKLNIIGASMNQLGRSVYVFCKTGKEKEIFEVFNTYKPEIKTYKLKVNNDQTIKFKEKIKDKNVTCK